jgi:hypothetical protein
MFVSVTVSYVVPFVACQLATLPLSWPLAQPGGPDGTVVVGAEVAVVAARDAAWE